MDKDLVLELLKKSSEPVSGEAISRQLGVSRAAVWKVIEELRTEGYEIASSTRKGYSLSQSPDAIRVGEIRANLQTHLVGQNIMCLDTIDSTNNEVKRQALSQVTNGLVIIADEQTGGRGRRGNSFSSPKGKGLYLSAVMVPSIRPAEALNLTAWVAVATCRAIESICGVQPQIKWTNDIVLDGKKLGGILTEMDVEAETGKIRYIVTGIGLNCNHQMCDFPEDVQKMATSISVSLGHDIHRADLAAALIRELDDIAEKFPNRGKTEYLTWYREHCITLGKEVYLVHPDKSRTKAFAESIDDEFRLVVRLEDGTEKTVDSGEVSVRGIFGYV